MLARGEKTHQQAIEILHSIIDERLKPNEKINPDQVEVIKAQYHQVVDFIAKSEKPLNSAREKTSSDLAK